MHARGLLGTILAVQHDRGFGQVAQVVTEGDHVDVAASALARQVIHAMVAAATLARIARPGLRACTTKGHSVLFVIIPFIRIRIVFSNGGYILRHDIKAWL